MVVVGRPIMLTGLLVGATDKPFCITGDPVVPPVPCVPPEVGTVGPDPTRGTLPHGLPLQIDPPLGIDDPPDVPPIGIGGVYGGIDGIVAPVPVVPVPRNVLGSVVPIGDPPSGGILDRVGVDVDGRRNMDPVREVSQLGVIGILFFPSLFRVHGDRFTSKP
jgi:hypothetical protein